MMNDILKKATLLMKSKRPPTPTDMLCTVWRRNDFVQLCFQSCGCRNDRLGSCMMCDYGTGRNIDVNEICKAFDDAIHSTPGKIHSLLLGTYGSFLDPLEISFENLYAILEKIEKCDIQTVIIETHCNTINEQTINMVSNFLCNRKVFFEFGFETANQFIQEHCLNKPIDLIKLKNAMDLVHGSNMQVTLNILLGAPFLSPSEQLGDALASIEWAFSNGADDIVLFPMNIKPYTLLEYLYGQGRYEPISHWLFIELISKMDESVLNQVSLSWYGNREIIYNGQNKRYVPPRSCPKCNNKIMDFYDAFVDSNCVKQKKYLIEEIIHIGGNCDCRSQMLQSLREMPPLNLKQRIKEEYKFLKSSLLLR